MVRLKKLASTCSFGGSLSEALRDRLVSGLHPKMSRTQRHLLSITELTYAAAHDKCITDEMAGKANIEHMGDSRRFNMTVLDIAWSRTAKGQTSANHVEVFSTSLNRVDSEMQHAITATRKVIYARYVKPDCHKCSLKEDQVVKRTQR